LPLIGAGFLDGARNQKDYKKEQKRWTLQSELWSRKLDFLYFFLLCVRVVGLVFTSVQ